MAPSGNPSLPWYKNVVAGAVAGVCEVLVMYPLDVVKTRLQLQKGTATAGGPNYTSMTDVFKTMIKQEGFGSLYRGILSPILAEAPKRAIKFTCNEQYKKLLAGKDGKLHHTWQHVAAGALAGMTEAFANCPFEVVKVRMQSRENIALFKSTPQAAMLILKHEGLAGIYQGLEPQLWRNAVWNGAYFSIINIVKNSLPASKDGNDIWRSFIAGTIAGGVATTLNTPFDVVKSRMQKGRVDPTVPKWALPYLVKIFKEEGFTALFKGYVPRMLRLGPGGGIMIVAFDVVSKLMS